MYIWRNNLNRTFLVVYYYNKNTTNLVPVLSMREIQKMAKKSKNLIYPKIFEVNKYYLN